jgi:pimeloyl-ACP methyl ester carboxylesterase
MGWRLMRWLQTQWLRLLHWLGLHDPKPVVVLIHGGGWVQGSPDDMRPLADEFRAAGWRTYRPTYPLWPDADVREMEDHLVNRVREIRREHPLSRLVLLGGSAGGQLALQAAERVKVDEVVALNPAINTCEIEAPYQDPHNGECERNRPGPPRQPTLLIHGTADEIVPISYARRFANHHHVTLIERDEGHGWFNGSVERETGEVMAWLG